MRANVLCVFVIIKMCLPLLLRNLLKDPAHGGAGIPVNPARYYKMLEYECPYEHACMHHLTHEKENLRVLNQCFLSHLCGDSGHAFASLMLQVS